MPQSVLDVFRHQHVTQHEVRSISFPTENINSG